MQLPIPTASRWLRLSLLGASGLVFAATLTSVCVECLRPAKEPPAPPGKFLLMDEDSFREVVGSNRLYEGIDDDFLAPAVRPARSPLDDPLLAPPVPTR